MADELPTISGPYTEWALGKANSARQSFPQTPSAFPAENDLWQGYFGNVMRGDEDGPWYGEAGSTTVAASKTFNEADEAGEKPPLITTTTIEGLGAVGTLGKGWPDGGFVPSVASPGEGNGADPALIAPMESKFVRKLEDGGAGKNQNGSIISPSLASTAQTDQDAKQIGRSPTYDAGLYGWSDLITPRPV